MNKLIYIVPFLLTFIACTSNKKQNTVISSSGIDSVKIDKKESVNKEQNRLPVHGEINPEKLTKYFHKLTDTIKNLGVIYSEKMELHPGNDIVVSLLHNTRIFDQMILCTHTKELDLIDNLYIGKATNFDNGKSRTIDYSILSNNEIVFNKVDWGYVKKENEEEIDTVKHDKLHISINNKGRIMVDNKQIVTLSVIDSVSIKELKYWVKDKLPTIFDYYRQETIEEHSAWSSKMFGRCCSNTDLTFNENLFFKISSNFRNKKYPITNISDTKYSTAFVFKPDSKVKISVEMDLDNSFLDGTYANKNVLNLEEVIMNPIKLSVINGYVKSKELFYKNGRVKELNVYINNQYIQSVILLDLPLVQEFTVNAVFKTGDNITLEPKTYYKGTKYDDICISEIQTNLGKTALSSLNKKYNLMELMNKK